MLSSNDITILEKEQTLGNKMLATANTTSTDGQKNWASVNQEKIVFNNETKRIATRAYIWPDPYPSGPEQEPILMSDTSRPATPRLTRRAQGLFDAE
jgi:hypothetical protein